MPGLLVIGGGAAGFFGAINAAVFHPGLNITILEKGTQVLGKVKVSGGGRCNVTHACFEAPELIKFYPRGGQELLGPFHQFMTSDVINWFEERGVELKVESDNRMFPKSNTSQSIIDCFLNETKKYGISIRTQSAVLDIEKNNKGWLVKTDQNEYYADNILMAGGSSPALWEIIRKLGHHVIPPVPSLFTFNINDPRISALPGLSVPDAKVTIRESNVSTEGPLLITHWGMSGPAVLRASAWAARFLAEKNYKCHIEVNWLNMPLKEVLSELKKQRDTEGKKLCGTSPLFNLPQRLWKSFTDHLAIGNIKWASLSNRQIEDLAKELAASEYTMEGKSTFKEEFVTCGGVALSEINMKSMESKIAPGLFFAGEIMDIDAVTGGFNFQAAWTSSWIAAKNLK